MAIIQETTDAPGVQNDRLPASTPYALAPGDRFEGRLTPFNDSDVFTADLQAGSDYVFTLQPAATAGTTGVQMRAWDGDQDLTTFVFDSAYTDRLEPTRLIAAPNPTNPRNPIYQEGIWQIEVKGLGALGGDGRYSVTLLEEIGRSSSTDTTARIGTPLTSAIDYAAVDRQFDISSADVDSIGFEAEAGVTYSISLTGANLSVSIGERGSSQEFGSDDTRGDGRAEVTFTPEESGRYIAEIAGLTGSETGAYTFLVDVPAVSIDDNDQGNLLTGGPGNDTILGNGGEDTITGDGGDDRLDGGADRDSIDGGAGNDTIFGGTGDDTLTGGDGDDTINGNAGADRMDGGAGNDTYVVDNRRDTVADTGPAGEVDRVLTPVDYALSGGGVEVLQATGRGNVRLESDASAHELIGNAGANILVGFGGEDTMTGGAGNDAFVLTGPSPNVTITDWGTGGDRLAIDDQLLGIGARGIDIRELTASVFRDVRESGAVGYNARTGELRLDIDGDGDRELVATIEGGARLGLDDVLLF
ncbi:calcium-binding protein [Jannaschia formosa]|uniref:calcium-binding protein n=1 Tax=Jannaschia formosa TaxID=2259592 RepID=UPI000E1BD2B8|nr:calcium-binding protein [Jannaschia formosa]TFL19259.1 calcium-binding protein [Jannaschia formosa]